jgi:hypothetical protein
MQKGIDLIVGIILVGLVALKWGPTLMHGQMRTEPESLVFHAAWLAFGTGVFMRYFTPDNAPKLAQLLRSAGIMLLVFYFAKDLLHKLG